MGDTGSLTLGGAIASVSILIKQELLLIIVGSVFVVEALSVFKLHIISILDIKLVKEKEYLNIA